MAYTPVTMEFIDRNLLVATPQTPAGLVRISHDPEDTERGVKRQETDVISKHTHLRWGGALKIIKENDTSAYKRRWVRQPDGTRALRVVRPEFDEMVRAIYAREIDGLIVWDLDRLVRQPRQLEDLIDAVEYTRIPVHSCSAGVVNLLTSDGRTMARVLCAMAIKASDDTARRVARAAFDAAVEGSATKGGPRRFGWQPDHLTLNDKEANAIRVAVTRATNGESLWSICLWFHERGITPVDPPRKNKTQSSGKFNRTTLNQILRSPRIAGIRMYSGVGRGQHVKLNDWRNRTVKVNGEYVLGPWTPIISVDDWETLQHALDAPTRKNKHNNGGSGFNARKHLLTSFLRCGACGSKMNGYAPTPRRPGGYYQCLPKDQGGCNGVSRDMARVDARVIELLMRWLERKAILGTAPTSSKETIAAAEAEEARLLASKDALREKWTAGAIGDADYFADRDSINEALVHVQTLISERRVLAKKQVLKHPRETWAKSNLSQRQALLGDAFTSITIMPQAKPGRWGWDPKEIRPLWKDERAAALPNLAS